MKSILTNTGPTIASGILLFLAYPALNLHFFAWIALVPLLYTSRNRSPRATMAHFFLAGWVFHTLVLQWLATNIFWAGGWALIGYQLMCIALSVYWALAGGLWKYLTIRSPRIGNVIALVFIWATMEYLQATLFTGFGWAALAHSQTPNPYILQWASIGGYLIIGMFVIAINALVTELFSHADTRPKTIGIIASILALLHGVGYYLNDAPTYAESPLRVGILQPSTPLQMKWDPQYRVALVDDAAAKSRLLANTSDVDLFVWPEALVMTNIEQFPIADTLKSLTRDTGADLFTGAQRTDDIRYFNSSYMIRPDSNQFHEFYDKMHLAPYGEYVPFSEYLPFLGRIIPAMSDQTPGDVRKTFDTHERTLGPLICFEVLFAPMSHDLKQDGADVLTVISNLGWFGHSNAAAQELAIAKVRAVETRLPIIHASNSGISGVIDPYGNLAPLDRFINHRGEIRGVRENLSPEETVNMRLAGVLDVPEPATALINYAPAYVPWIAGIGCIGIILSTLLMSANGGNPPKPSKKKSTKG